MYASQTKRLCVRGASSDDTRVQHLNSSSTSPLSGATTGIIQQQTNSNLNIQENQLTPAIISQQQLHETPVGGSNYTSSNMTGPSATGLSRGEEIKTPFLTSSTCKENLANASEHDLINQLANEAIEETKLELLLYIRNLITACNRKKDSVVNNPKFKKIVELLDDSSSSQIKIQVALLLCSLAKSGEHIIKVFNESTIDEKIWTLLLNSQDDELLFEACLRCLRSIMSWPRVSRTWVLYEGPASDQASSTKMDKDPSSTQISNLNKILAHAQISKSFIVQECVADIFGSTCIRHRDRALVYKAGAIGCITQFLESSSCRVVIASLYWLTQMCTKNHHLSTEIINTSCPSGTLVLDRLAVMMNKDRCYEFRFLAARCYAHIYRATDLLKDDPRIVKQVLPSLVQMVHKERPPQLRVRAAECIAYLTENEVRLQNIASICDHLIDSLVDMIEYAYDCSTTQELKIPLVSTRKSPSLDRCVTWLSITPNLQPPVLELAASPNELSRMDSSMADENCSELCQEMKQAAFLALASLASNLEPIRKKIFNSCSVMQQLVKSLTDSDTRTLKPVLTCLLSLSRSVQQLRTSFAENSVHMALKSLLNTTTNDVLVLVLANMCNMSLDFSPDKQHFLDSSTIDTLCDLTRGTNPKLRLHGMWILMNMVYQLRDDSAKHNILRLLGMNHLLRLLEIEDDDEMVLKTLGFLRNLLSHRLHIDDIMHRHDGQAIMEALINVLKRNTSDKIKEQCVCVLTNIADGPKSKSFFMENKILFAYLVGVVGDDQKGDLRLAALCCLTNLANKEHEGFQERQEIMRRFGFEEKLKSMLNHSDPVLSDRIRTCYNQFLIGVNDKYVD